MSHVASVVSLLLSALGIGLLVNQPVYVSPTLGVAELGLSIRLDALSVLMFTMINLIAFVVLRFSQTYLDGDERQGLFLGKLAATIASVQLLVIAGNLGLLFIAWVLTSYFLHALLKFYPHRQKAIIAARKKFIAARLSDGFLLIAVIGLYFHFGTGDLGSIMAAVQENAVSAGPPLVELSAACIALSALMKSAQFPLHAWLIEVMETPTPVSALLHAGLLNAGPFLVARLAFVVTAAEFAAVLLVVLGGFTALFGTLSYLTQTSVKTALGYSSISHMGFSLLMCGLGLYPAAMLHMVAHSFYKAHAFLSSGSAVETLVGSRVALPGTANSGTFIKVLSSMVLAFAMFGGLSFAFGINPMQEESMLFISAVIVMGLSMLFMPVLRSGAGFPAVLRTAVVAAAVTASFWILENGIALLMGAALPPVVQPSVLLTILASLLLLLFLLVIFIQMAGFLTPAAPFWRKMAIHFRNGLYANAWSDRTVRAAYVKAQEAERR
ncbi:MAG: proton-conducting transporter membrane subunit [Cyclonatronaceae bacterium]